MGCKNTTPALAISTIFYSRWRPLGDDQLQQLCYYIIYYCDAAQFIIDTKHRSVCRYMWLLIIYLFE